MSISDKLITIADNQQKVFDAGYEKGKSEGGGDNWYDTFWNGFQNNGNRMDYAQAFRGAGWRGSTFKPKYNMTVTNGSYFLYASGVQADPIDLIALEEDGLIIDFSQCTKIEAAFSQSLCLATVGTVDLSSMTGIVNSLFSLSRFITKIKLLKLHEGITSYPSMFKNCDRLEEIAIDGVISADLDFKSSPLNMASLKSIITHLKNYKGTEKEWTYTLTLSSESKTLLDNAGTTSPNNTTWEIYITESLGWNLA